MECNELWMQYYMHDGWWWMGCEQKGNLIYVKKVIYNNQSQAASLQHLPIELKSLVLPRVKFLAIGECSSVVHRQHVAALCFTAALIRFVDDVDFQLVVFRCFAIHRDNSQEARGQNKLRPHLIEQQKRVFELKSVLSHTSFANKEEKMHFRIQVTARFHLKC